MPEPTDVKLTYARPTRRWWRRRWVRFALLLTVLAGMAAAWLRWGGILRLQADVYLAQRRCLRWTSPPDHVVFETSPQAAARLRANGYEGWAAGPPGDARLYDIAYPTDAVVPLNRYFEARGRLERHHGMLAYHALEGLWALFEHKASLAFLHGRRAPGGREYLVAVGVSWEDTHHRVSLQPIVKPAAKWTTPADLEYGWVERPTANAAMATPAPLQFGMRFSRPHFRLYAGQPDPDDRSRFTIDYEIEAARGTIEGRLSDDGQVRLQFLSGPGKGKED